MDAHIAYHFFDKKLTPVNFSQTSKMECRYMIKENKSALSCNRLKFVVTEIVSSLIDGCMVYSVYWSEGSLYFQ